MSANPGQSAGIERTSHPRKSAVGRRDLLDLVPFPVLRRPVAWISVSYSRPIRPPRVSSN